MQEQDFQNYSNINFDPNTLGQMTSTVIMAVVVTDISPSIEDFEDAMNQASREVFMKELKTCHRKDDIVLKNITFNEQVKHKSGFQPILNLNDDYLDVKGCGRGTALYDAVLEALTHSEQYRNDLEKQGIEVRTCIFIITDGKDNSSALTSADKIKKKIAALRQNEAWVGSYTINMLGVGEVVHFTDACIEMGLDPHKCLVTISATAKEIREQLGVISRSVSKSQAASTVSF